MPSSSLMHLQNKQLMLVPFAVLVSFFMFSFKPILHLTPQTVPAALAKAAPIWYLAVYVGITPRFNENPLALGARVGLVLSSLGDICLVWRYALFLPGMLFFGLAQIAYIYGLGTWFRRGSYPTERYVRECVLMGIVFYVVLFFAIESWFMAICVLCYSILLMIMLNLALQRHFVEGNKGSFYGAAGAISFFISDGLIGFNRWILPLPFFEGLILLSYYFAQGAIAFGTVSSTRTRKRD